MRSGRFGKIFLVAAFGLVFSASRPLRGEITLTVDRDAVRQTIHGFGASDAWRIQFIGKYWPLEAREALAELLFSREFDAAGNPKGIALSLWRFNIGAGSAEQGAESGISRPWFRAECFLGPDGLYDWTKQAGEQWFLEAARRRGVEHVLGFANSPPVFFTRNGLARSSGGRAANLKDECAEDFAGFLAEVGAHFRFDYLSPVNEPQWEWADAKQEGSPFSNAEDSRLVRALDRELRKRGSKSQIVFGEAGSIAYLGSNAGSRPDAGNQIEELFAAGGKHNLAGLPTLMNVVAAHSYWTVWPVGELIGRRRELREKMKEVVPGFDYWQSEYCVMEENGDVGGGPGRDLGIDTALYVARIIHFDLTIADASSWQWWTAVSDADYKDGLIYIDPIACGRETASEEEKAAFGRAHSGFAASKLLWALGNYSRFVRPGMRRLEIKRNDGATEEETAAGLMVSAYVDPATDKIVLVAENYSDKPEKLRIARTGFKNNESVRYRLYETSASADLAFKGKVAEEGEVPPRSIVTFAEE